MRLVFQQRMDLDALPDGVFCITLEGNLSDLGVIEHYLAEHRALTEKCIPIALRNMLSPDAEALGFPPMHIPSAHDTIAMLKSIWNVDAMTAQLTLKNACRQELTYLLPYIHNMHKALNITGIELFCNSIDVVRMLMILFGDTSLHNRALNALSSELDTATPDFAEALLSPMTLPGVTIPGAAVTVQILVQAAANCDTPILATILSHIAPEKMAEMLKDTSPHDHRTALLGAIVGGRMDNVAYLLERKADIHEGNGAALTEALEVNRTEIVDFLIQKRATPTIVQLDNVASDGNLDVVKLIVEAKIMPTGETISAAAEGGSPEVIKYLAASGGDIHADEDNAVRVAVSSNRIDAVRTLIELKADTSVIVREDLAPNDTEMRDFLYKMNVDIDNSDSDEDEEDEEDGTEGDEA